MRSTFIICLSICLICLPQIKGINNLIGSAIQPCLNCLCHARTSCWSRINCARYSINFNYWKTAGSPVISLNYDPDEQKSYAACMRNENCILNTIKQYTDKYAKDCNCDGTFDCKDRLAIHLFGENCENPSYGPFHARNFNHCAKKIGVKEMVASEGSPNCSPDAQ